MNANLSPDCLIALGIVHQIKYPLYYIKKINLKITKEQEEKIYRHKTVHYSIKRSTLYSPKYIPYTENICWKAKYIQQSDNDLTNLHK